MDRIKHILLLDDDPAHLADLAHAVESSGHIAVPARDVGAAARALAVGIDFAIVDLFLEGDDGDELSNDFIAQHLIPAGIRYARMSSAPGLVPKELSGVAVHDKRAFRKDRAAFLDVLEKWLAA